MNLHRQQVHPEFVEGCFGCKVGTLQLNAGDAKSNIAMSRKKWDGELQAYRDARSQGIQPAGTSMRHIDAARKASDTLGRPYDAGTMVNANKINDRTAAITNYIDTGKGI